MNITNIFGLHIGCKVKYDDIINIIFGVSVAGVISIEPKPIRFDRCKIILKPLSAITDEDKAELAKFIENSYHKKGEVVISNVYWCPDLQGLKYTRNGSKMQIYDDSPEIMFKLATMGYDIGLVPDEYKEVAE